MIPSRSPIAARFAGRGKNYGMIRPVEPSLPWPAGRYNAQSLEKRAKFRLQPVLAIEMLRR